MGKLKILGFWLVFEVFSVSQESQDCSWIRLKSSIMPVN
jgi:hypothetical protein